MNAAAVVQEAPRRSLLDRQRVALEMIARDAPLSDTLALLCHIVEAEAEQPVRASILLVDRHANCLRTGAAPGLPEAYNRAIDGIGISSGVGTCAAAAALGTAVTTPDIGADPRWNGLAHLPLGLGLVAAWSMPIQRPDGSVLGTLGTYFTEHRTPNEQEIALVAFLAQTAALAIERAGDRSSA
jgi:GAF domain-containing protein